MKKKFLVLLCLLYSFTLLSQEFEIQSAEKFFDHIIVEKSDYNFKSDKEFNRKRRPKYLREFPRGTFPNNFGSWDKFPYDRKRFDSVSAENTENNWIIFRDKMIELSRAKNLDYISLTKCLEMMKDINEDKALIPIAAYQCMNRDRALWVIICLWEFKKTINVIINRNKSGYGLYGHYIIYAIDLTNFDIIASTSCG